MTIEEIIQYAQDICMEAIDDGYIISVRTNDIRESALNKAISVLIKNKQKLADKDMCWDDIDDTVEWLCHFFKDTDFKYIRVVIGDNKSITYNENFLKRIKENKDVKFIEFMEIIFEKSPKLVNKNHSWI